MAWYSTPCHTHSTPIYEIEYAFSKLSVLTASNGLACSSGRRAVARVLDALAADLWIPLTALARGTITEATWRHNRSGPAVAEPIRGSWSSAARLNPVSAVRAK
jgi:hypothetical protein